MSTSVEGKGGGLEGQGRIREEFTARERCWKPHWTPLTATGSPTWKW